MKLAHSDNHEWSRRIETKKAIDKESLSECLQMLNNLFVISNTRHPIPVNTITQASKENQTTQNMLHEMLNYYEGLAIGINQGVYDEKIIKKTWKGTMKRIDICFSDYIDYQRNEVQKEAWVEFTALLNKMDTPIRKQR